MHRKVAAALVAALALGIGGCGGSEKTLTRAELVRQVEVACREGQREGQKQTRTSRGANDQAAFIAAVLAGQKATMDRISNFNASGAAKADFEAFKAGVQERIDGIERIASVKGAERARLIRTEQPRLEASGTKVQEAARRLGLRGCN